MKPLSQAITDWANIHKETLINIKYAIQTGNYSLAIEFLDMDIKIMDEMTETLAKI